MKMTKRTKIIATIGPASKDVDTLVAMIKAGMNVARLNFSHGSYPSHAELIKNIRSAVAKTKTVVGILQDLSGPKLRLGEFAEKTLKAGESVVLGHNGIPTARPIWQWIKTGQSILIDDGLVELVATKVSVDSVETKVLIGGKISAHKGINLPGIKVELPSISEKDKADLEFGLKMGIDFVAQSFVKSISDIRQLKKMIKKFSGRVVPVIAKIETPEALKNIDSIIEASDAIMVARGDLALNIPQELAPVAQKNIVKKCVEAGKPVIMATQMLDSMIRNPRPTRAELSDVANAVLDHVDAVMLSGESAFGSYPVKAVEVMAKVISEIEPTPLDNYQHPQEFKHSKLATLAHGLIRVSRHSSASAIVVSNLDLVKELAKFKPEFPIIFVSKNLAELGQAALIRAVISLQLHGSVTSTIHNSGLVQRGKRYVDTTATAQLSAHIQSMR